MVLEKVKNKVKGVRSRPGCSVELIINITNNYGEVEKAYTSQRYYYHKTPISYPTVFSGLF